MKNEIEEMYIYIFFILISIYLYIIIISSNYVGIFLSLLVFIHLLDDIILMLFWEKTYKYKTLHPNTYKLLVN